MAKFQLNPGETLIGSGMMSIYLKQGLSKKPFQGNIYITNQRACFKISMMPGALDMDLPYGISSGFVFMRKQFAAFSVVRPAAHVSNGCKSRIRPVVGRI